MTQTLKNLLKSITEKDEHKRSPDYRKLSPALKKAVDDIMVQLSKSLFKVLKNLKKTTTDLGKKHKVKPNEIEKFITKVI